MCVKSTKNHGPGTVSAQITDDGKGSGILATIQAQTCWDGLDALAAAIGVALMAVVTAFGD
jgi:hypothetical protein